jgi:hypothetical protein
MSFSFADLPVSQGPGNWASRWIRTPEGRKVLELNNILFFSSTWEWMEDIFEKFVNDGCKIIKYIGPHEYDSDEEFQEIIKTVLYKAGIKEDDIIQIYDLSPEKDYDWFICRDSQ